MQTILIGIAGPSGAGKSTFCRRLEQSHTNVGRLKLDDFFCDLEEVPIVNGYQDWDDPACIDWNGLVSATKTLKEGRSAVIPHYDRALDRCTGEKCVLPKQIIIVDGFLTLHHPTLRNLLDLSFFFTLPEPEQMARRKARQPWVEEGYLTDVMIPNARAHVLPSAQHASHVIDALQPPEAIYETILSLLLKQNIFPRSKSSEDVSAS